jgi:hypothetical protein
MVVAMTLGVEMIQVVAEMRACYLAFSRAFANCYLKYAGRRR